jgi:RHS repeat-associated protein
MSAQASTKTKFYQFGNLFMRVCVILSMVLSNLAIQSSPVSADAGEETQPEKVEANNVWDRPLTWLDDARDRISEFGEGLFWGEEESKKQVDDIERDGVVINPSYQNNVGEYSESIQAKPLFDEVQGFTAVYFSNMNLTPPAYAVLDGGTINYSWGVGSPDGLPGDRFSIRWFGKFINNEITEAEVFTFTSTNDDGVSLRINGNTILDSWSPGKVPVYTAEYTIEPGVAYDFVFEYYEDGGDAYVQLEMESATIAKRYLAATDFQKVNLDGINAEFTYSKESALADGEDSVAVDLTISDENNDPISDDIYVRVSGKRNLLNGVGIDPSEWIQIEESETPGLYQFELSSSEPEEKEIRVRYGNYPLTVISDYEFRLADLKSGLRAEFYANKYLEEPSYSTLDNQTIDYDWDYTAPIDGMPADYYSVRWTGFIQADYSEMYTFYTLSDDGIRLWIDGTLVVDSWIIQGPTYHSGQFLMTAGEKYGIVVEYYEENGEATAELEWESASQARKTITRNNLSMPKDEFYNFDVDFSKTEIVSDGIDSTQITVQLTDSLGDPLDDEEVYIQASGINNTFNGANTAELTWLPLLPVGTSGQYVGELKSTSKGTKNLKFMVRGVALESEYSVQFTDVVLSFPQCEITSYINENEEEVFDLTVASGQSCRLVPGEYEFVNLLVEGNLYLQSDNYYDEETGEYYSDYVHIIAEEAEVTETGHISADGLGYASGEGPGAPADGDDENTPGGGGFAGYGGDGDLAGGTHTFGILTDPDAGNIVVGSGGGGPEGGAGGGIVHITVSNSFIMDGEISADGEDGTNYIGNLYSGGGAGGTILLDGQFIQGSGTITADGGKSAENCTITICGGGGSGGEILLYSDLSDFNDEGGIAHAYGGYGKGEKYGAAGGILRVLDNELVLNNNQHHGKSTVINPEALYGENWVNLLGNASLLLPKLYSEYNEEIPCVFSDDDIFGDGTGELITECILYANMQMIVDGYDFIAYDDSLIYGDIDNIFDHLTVKSGSTVTFVPRTTTGIFNVKANNVTVEAGGVIRSSDPDGTLVFDMDQNPEGGVLTINGVVSANGGDGKDGGTLQINAHTLSGGGTIQANGGSGEAYGDGGLIDVNYLNNQFTGSMEAFGGEFGDFAGNPGIINHNQGEKLVVDNHSNPGSYEFPEGIYAYDRIELGNGIELTYAGENTDVTIQDGVYSINGELYPTLPVLTIEGVLNYSTNFVVDKVILNWAGQEDFNFDVDFSKTEILRDGVDATRISVELTDTEDMPLSGQDVYVRVSGQGNTLNGATIDASEWVQLAEDGSTGIYIGELQSTTKGTRDIEFKVNYYLISSEYSVEFIEVNQGEGLRGEYFENATLTGTPCKVNYDENINFAIGSAWPNPVGSTCSVVESVRWTGILTPELSGTYQFYASHSQMKVWVNGVEKESTAGYLSMDLAAGQEITLVVELSGITGLDPAQVSLEWVSDQVTREIVPSTNLSFVNFGQSTFTNATASILADGEETTQITIQAKRDDGRVLAGYPVFIKVSGEGNILNGVEMQVNQWTEVGTTDATGTLTGLISTDVAGTKQITATIDGMLLQQTASFIAIQPEVYHLQVLFEGETAAPNTVLGKTGTIKTIYKGDPVPVTFRVVNQTFNLLATANGTATLSVTDENATYPQTVNIVNGIGKAYIIWSETGDQSLSITGNGDLDEISGNAVAPVTDTLIVANGKTVYMDAVRTYLNANLTAGSSSITVKSATGFYPGHRILLLKMTGTEAGEYESLTISNVSGNQITLQTPTSMSYLLTSGKVLVLLVPRISHLTVQSGGTLTAASWDGNTGGVLYLDVDELTVESGGVVHADAKGYPQYTGPGLGTSVTGGGYGGEGASSTYPAANGKPYGSPTEPFLLGSGGGEPGFTSGGIGAGIVKINAGQVTNQGTISTNGGTGGDFYGQEGGGGSGGSIWISADVLTGTGTIRSTGGRGGQWNSYVGYGGGGGRIAINVETNQFTGTVQAYGGYGTYYGGAGSIYWANENKLVINNANLNCGSFSSVLLSDEYHFDAVELKQKGSLIIRGANSSFDIGPGILTADGTVKVTSEGELVVGGALNVSGYSLDAKGKLTDATSLMVDENQTLNLYSPTSLYSGEFTFENLEVRSNASLILHTVDDSDENYADDFPFTINAGNVSVAASGKILLNGFGYLPTSGTGHGPGGGWGSATSGSYGVGGSHGGKAGDNQGGQLSAEPYGNLENPITFGSAGGAGGTSAGANGGGAFHLNVTNNVTLNGTISANGNATTTAGGGGAGGSIWIGANQVLGTGSLLANGGGSTTGSGGGGGRIAIIAETIAPAIVINVNGGSGKQNAQHGTIYLETVDVLQSSVVADPLEVAVGGVAASQVLVKAIAENGHAMPYQNISVTLVDGSSILINGTPLASNNTMELGETDSTGKITFAASAKTIGARELKVAVDGVELPNHVIINFTAGNFNPDLSTVISTPLNVPADGETTAAITVTALDKNSLPIMNVEIGLTAIGDAEVVQPETLTDANGRTVGYISSATVENVTVIANAWGIPITQVAIVNFYGTDFVSQLVAPQRVIPGQDVNISVSVKNNQAYDVDHVSVALTLPESLTYVDGTFGTEPVIADQIYTWTVSHLAANQEIQFTVHCKVAETAVVGETLPLSLSASSAVAEINPSNNTSHANINVVQGYSFDTTISPANTTLYLGGQSTYTIKVKNTDLLPDLYTLSVSGLDQFTTSLSASELAVDAGGNGQAVLTIGTNTCMAEASVSFTVLVTSTESGIVKELPATLTLNMSPGITLVAPQNNATSGSRSVLISWRTATNTTGKLTLYPTNAPDQIQEFTTVEGTIHTVQVENLERHTSYSWFVNATSACGSGTSSVRSLTIGNGIVFTSHSHDITINRDYDQRVMVAVKNEDSVTHTLTSNVLNSYQDLIVNFVDSGSVDETITLAPGQTVNLTLAIHAQDAVQHNYTLTANLTADEDGTPIVDNATLNVEVLYDGDFSIVEDVSAYDETTLARTYVITNNGQVITDLSLEAVDPDTGLPASIYLTPSLDHARLATGESIRVVAYPIFTEADLQAQNEQIVYAPTMHMAALREDPVSGINFTLKGAAAGNTVSVSGSSSCTGGKQIYLVVINDCEMSFATNDWYCTNRPVINTPIRVPAFVSLDAIENVSLQMTFSPHSDVRPHNGDVYFNDTLVNSFVSQIPDGTFNIPVPSGLWRESMAGMVTQNIKLVSVHPNGGHYSSSADYAINVQVDNAMTFACAATQEEAEASTQKTYACNASSAINLETDVNDNSILNLAEIKKFIQSTIEEYNIPVNVTICTQGDCADPIDTRTGVFSMGLPDLSFPTSAGNLVFQRAYSTGSIEQYQDVLGYGWTHNHAASLIFPTDTNGMEGYVLFKDHLGNQHLFKIEQDGTYKPGPGVLAGLAAVNNGYIVTAADGTTFNFDSNGLIISRADALGNAFTYTYDEDDVLQRVSADNGSRFIDFSYNADGRIESVTDYTGREVSYAYDASGNLVSSTDLLDQEWTYEYDSKHRMTSLVDPMGDDSVTTTYDMVGRAYSQYDGDGNMIARINYHKDGSVTVVDANGKSETHRYDDRGIMIEGTDQVARDTDTDYDANFRPTTITNEIGSTLSMEWSADGKNLLAEVDPAGNRTEYTYDTLGNLTSTTDPSGNTKSYTYDGTLLTSTTDEEGKTTTYTYTPEGWLASQTDSYGRTTSYTYDTHGQRLTTTDWLGETTGTTYDALGNQIETVDAQGRVNRNEYNEAGQLLRSIRNYDAARLQNAENLYNLITSYTYDLYGNQETVTDTLGNVTRYEYDSSGHLLRTIDTAGHITRNTYDGNGQLIATTDALGHKTTYVYDAAGRRLSTVNALGISSGTTAFNLTNNTSTASDSAGNAAVYYYNALNQVTKIVDPMGHETTTTYNPDGSVATKTDELGRTTTYEYDDLNRLVKTTDSNGAVTQSVYDEEGYRVASIDALGHQTTYTYDDMGRVVATTDALGHQTTSTYDEEGKLVSSTDTMGRTTSYEYDEWGRKSAMTDGAGRRTTYTYDVLDRVIGTTGPTGTTSTTYDALGRVVAQTDEHGRTSTTTYNDIGRMIASKDYEGNVTGYTYDAVGNLIASVNDQGTTSYKYDAINRRISTTDAAGNTSRTVYDRLGNVSDEIAANGVVTHYIYDALQRNTAIIQNYKEGVAASADTNVRMDYTYNAVGNRIYVNDANGHVTEFQYDAANRVTKKIDPLGNTWSYTYDLAGNLISRTDGNGDVTGFSYDAGGNLLTIDYPDPDTDVSFTYDASGQRLTMTDGLGTTTWHYDEQGRLETVTDAYGSLLTYSYDDEGNRTGLTYPDGKQVAYTYDIDNHLALVADWETQETTYEYDALGQLASLLRPNGVTSTYAYDELGRLTSLDHSNEETSLATYVYTYDAVGNIIHAEENVSGSGASGPTVLVTVVETTGEPLAGISVYAFKSTTYSGFSKITDENGQVSITLPEGTYRFRADVPPSGSQGVRTQFWSGETDHCEIGHCGQVTMTIPEAVTVSVMDTNSIALAGIHVYAFSGTTYSSYNGTTDENGQISLRLPVGDYKFRADYPPSGGPGGSTTEFWSGTENHCTVPGCTMASIRVTVPLVVSVKNDLGEPMAGLNVYAFSGTTYSGKSGKTDANGEVEFSLPEGNYRFRADLPHVGGAGGVTQFWSGSENHCTLPGCSAALITVSLPVTLTVVDTGGDLIPNVNVYAFKGTTYSGYSKKTDANGEAVFTLPAGDYRFRADIPPSGGQGGSTQFWSGTANTCNIPGCTADSVTVTQPVTVTVLDSNGAPQENLNIYAFSGSTYAGYSKKTNANGEATFTLPLADYRFRADLNGTQFWSSPSNSCSLPQCGSDQVTVTIPLQVVVQDGVSGVASVNIYAFNGTTYSGYSKTTNTEGVALFTLPMGDYRFRADVNGTQVFSNAINHCTVPGCELVGIQIGIAPTQTPTAIPTETFTETPTPGSTVTETYTPTIPAGTNTPTVENTSLPVNTNTPEPENTATPTLENTEVGMLRSLSHFLAMLRMAPLAADTGVSVTVLNTDGIAMSGLNVYAFDGSAYSGKSAVTNESGIASFTLAEGIYRFRADLNTPGGTGSTQFWSATENHCTTPDCTSANITVTKPITIAVQDTDGTAQAGLNVYAFNGTTYAGYSKVTNESGEAVFILPQGDYRFRADVPPSGDQGGGTQFWSGESNNCTLPGCESAEVTVTKPLTVSVRNSDGTTQAGLNVYAFNGTTYTGYSKVTGEDGTAVFVLPQGDYRFRSDLNGTQFWSATENHCTLPGCVSADITVTIPLTISVTDTDGTPQSGITVYAFNNTTYMGFSKTTNETGQAVFTLPSGDYRFRADVVGTQYWSSESNDCTLPGCTAASVTTSKPVTVSVVDSFGTPQIGLNIYAFEGTTYTGYSKISDGNGTAAFYLPSGDYRFRADVPPVEGQGGAGTQFWSAETNTCTLPGCESAVVTVTPPVTLTVVDTDGLAQAGLNVYAFNGTTYTGYSKVTDANGQAVFILPAGDYRFRADIPPVGGQGGAGTQFWSAETNTCTLPGCTTAAVTVTKPVTVTVAGEAENPYVGLTVYAFDGSTYSGYSAVTDAGGKVMFTLPMGSYRFRADYDGVEFWSGNENTCTLPGCTTDAVILPGGTGLQEVSIDYTYDALNRLISAEYSNGTKFAYTYDAAGNVLTCAATHYGITKTTIYMYDAANQLLTANDATTEWHYTYDGNGSLIESDPGTSAANGSTRYTYNTAGYLVKLETHNGTDWQTQSEMKYDGLGNRLETTTYDGEEATTTRYVLDSGSTLTSIAGETSTFYLYGRGVIGTLGESWSYILQDGAGSTRQLATPDGAVTLSISYTPWGDTLEVYGSGMLNLGYMGGVYDAGTGLIYMGNGQYYDPSTGRFLTRGANAEQSNPYTPWNTDPSGMLIAPLALLALVFGRKKNRTKLDHFVILIVIAVSLGMSGSACSSGGTIITIQPSETPTPTEPAKYLTARVLLTQTAGATVTATITVEPADKPTIVITSTATLEPGCGGRRTSEEPMTDYATMLLNAILKQQNDLPDGFPVALLLAMAVKESGGNLEPYRNSTTHGGALQLRKESGHYNHPYKDTPEGYDLNVKDAIAFINEKYEDAAKTTGEDNLAFHFLYTADFGYQNNTNEVNAARAVLYYNGGMGWWSTENEYSYVNKPLNKPYVGEVADMLKDVVPRDFGYCGDPILVEILKSVQAVVNAYLPD